MRKHLSFLFILILSARIATAQSKDIPGPVGSGQFGYSVTVLPNGNYVVTDPFYDEVGKADIGAVYLFNGKTHAQISKLTGSTAGDQVGGTGVTILTNGNYVIKSTNWDNGAAVTDAGAVTWASGSTGVSGVVSSTNSLVGSSLNDRVGNSSIVVLTNGNYVIASSNWDNGTFIDAGAVTWGSGSMGVNGTINSSNSLVGTKANDRVGNGWHLALANGNYVILSSAWDSGNVVDAGAATWADGTTGIAGNITASNSLIGTKEGDFVGSFCRPLTNGNYLVVSTNWDNGNIVNAGAVAWANGTTGIVGTINAGNSLIGTTSSDLVGSDFTLLNNGNYIVTCTSWDNGNLINAGAVTWANGATGIVGVINAGNSLIGTSAYEEVGYGGLITLSNGNYVIASPKWSNGDIYQAGAVTWGSGATGVRGVISSANSLVGTASSHSVGSGGVVALTNGNYVVESGSWSKDDVRGAVTWANGTTGIQGTINSYNSLVGTASRHTSFGSGKVTALVNGNYVVSSPTWGLGEFELFGAVTWGSGTSGVSGAITENNSLIGNNTWSLIGSEGVTALTNGNYVVSSDGVITWGNGGTGTTGTVSGDNSLIGTSGATVYPLLRGNYIVRSPSWESDNGLQIGAVTFGNGGSAIVGAVSSANSLVGNSMRPLQDMGDVNILANGNYVVRNWFWDNGETIDAGAITWGSGIDGVTGEISPSNSLVGSLAGDKIGQGSFFNLPNVDYVFSSKWTDGNGGSKSAMTWGNGSTGVTGTTILCNTVVGSGAISFNPTHNYLLVSLPLENKLTIFTPTGMNLSITQEETTVDISGEGSVPLVANANCQIIANLVANGDYPVQGVVHAKTWVEGSVPSHDGQPFVARHYQITPDDNASTATGRLTLYFTQAEFNAFNSHSGSTLNLPANGSDASGKTNLRIVKFSGTSSDDTGLPDSYENGSFPINPDDDDIVWNEELSRWEVSFDVEGFSGFIVQTEFDPLPVRLISFKGKAQENNALLDWKIADAYNFSHFEVERSKDAKRFESIGRVELIKEKSSYQFTDENALRATNDKNRVYYRLKLTDLDGTYAYSKMVELEFAGSAFNYVYPNPFTNSMSVILKNHNGETVTVDLRNQSGELLLTQKVSVAQDKLDFEIGKTKLSAGTYILTIHSASEVVNLKVVRE